MCAANKRFEMKASGVRVTQEDKPHSFPFRVGVAACTPSTGECAEGHTGDLVQECCNIKFLSPEVIASEAKTVALQSQRCHVKHPTLRDCGGQISAV